MILYQKSNQNKKSEQQQKTTLYISVNFLVLESSYVYTEGKWEKLQ